MAQVAFSFLLLAGSGLFVRTLANLKQTNAGFQDLDNLVTFQIDPALSGYSVPRLQIFYQQLLEGVRATPGVKSAGFAMVPVLSGDEWDSTMSVEGHTAKDGEDNAGLHERRVERLLEDDGRAAGGGPRFQRSRFRQEAHRGDCESQVRHALLRR